MAFPGNILRQKRELLGFSRNYITRHLSIPAEMLHIFENGDFSQLESISFATGFLRSYCNFLGIEAEMMIAALQKEAKTPSESKNTAPKQRNTFDIPKFQLPAITHYVPSELIAWVSITLLILLGWFTYNTLSPDMTYIDDNTTDAAEIDLRAPTPRVNSR
jgi:cytoskeletal protein RodZ